MKNKVLQLNTGKPIVYNWKGKQISSAIGKDQVKEAFLTKMGFNEDGVANLEHHGGPERAVCLYPYEHYNLWGKEFSVKLEIPAFGENITINGMLENEVYIGDVFQLDEAVVQICQGRVPCSKISKFNGIENLLERVFHTGYTGYFFRVLEEGKVSSDADMILKDRENGSFSVLRANQIYLHEQDNITDMKKLMEISSLSSEWKSQLNKKISKQSK
ncbi:MOSC domain-containing protein [Mesobacillus harenae]|uniref:MOSC domain-containing protein n=1 Tax=Mesobacillus harenae TaxID=2213203 RepID=UPI00158104BA|nr:MOSC domain-containing protein [Mesobacillus harenae]